MIDRRPHVKTPMIERRNYDGLLCYLEHGFPNPLVRWHCHEEYELHLIVSTSGTVFVGDYTGDFSPGHLVLIGPRVPHNWVTSGVEAEGVSLRDMVLQFSSQPLNQAAKNISELSEILPLLELSKYGVEFADCGAEAEQYFIRIRESRGADRFAEFLRFMSVLSRKTDYRLLSSATQHSSDDNASMENINFVLNYIEENYCNPMSADFLAEQLGMSLSSFSRFFRASTGIGFNSFINQIRINKACQLLLSTKQYVTNVCYNVGFNNVANFNRRFLQVKGVTPKEFRRKGQGQFSNKPLLARENGGHRHDNPLS